MDKSPAIARELAIVRLPLSSLHEDPANARAHGSVNMEAIAGSLARFGQAEPLVVQARTHRVIGGNGRLAAMRKLGWTECDVVELEVSDSEATALGIALNRTAELAEWDEGTLARLLQSLRNEGELTGIGFTDEEVDSLIDELAAGLGTPSDIEDPGPGEVPERPVSRGGDLWILGDHRLLCGDSTRAEDIRLALGGEKARLLATDPPYLVNYRGAGKAAAKKDEPHWDDFEGDAAAEEFFRSWLAAALPSCVANVAIYQWHGHRRQALVEAAWKANGLLVHQQIIWVKTRGVLSRCHYMWRHEPCFYGWVEGSMPAKERRPPANSTTVWEIDQAGETKEDHATQKPVEIFARPIEYHTRPGDIVLEPFSGSGSQLIAAERLGRRCAALEKHPGYVDAAIARWEKATGKEARLDGGGSFGEVAAERGGGAW